MWDEYNLLKVYESIIKRAAILNEPFMLKGSLLTRQYYPKKNRCINDIDWVYMKKIDDKDEAGSIFSKWMTKITEMDLDDDVIFRSFKENDFWRMIDYAMDDDFPTVNTDIAYKIKGKDNIDEVGLDISFNLDLDFEPVPILYETLEGEKISFPYTVPLSVQAAWKLHQTVVRARFKDLVDLKYIFSHKDFTSDLLQEMFQTLVNELYADKIYNNERLKSLLSGNFDYIFNEQLCVLEWGDYNFNAYVECNDEIEALNNPGKYTTYGKSKYARWYKKQCFDTFASELWKVMNSVGIDENSYNLLPKPTKKSLYPELED